FEQLFVRLLKFQVRSLNLPQAENGYPESRCRDRAECCVDPRKHENERYSEKIKTERGSMIVLQHISQRASTLNRDDTRDDAVVSTMSGYKRDQRRQSGQLCHLHQVVDIPD